MAKGYYCPECGELCDEDGSKRKDEGEGRRYKEKDFEEILDSYEMGSGMCSACMSHEEESYCDGNCDDCSNSLPSGECSVGNK